MGHFSTEKKSVFQKLHGDSAYHLNVADNEKRMARPDRLYWYLH